MSEQREALAEVLCDVMCMHEPGYHECYGKADRVLASDALARLLADAEQQVAAAALAVVKRACDIECKSPGKHTGCSSHEPYRALIGAALTTGAAAEVRAEVKAAVEEWFINVSLDDLFTVKGWAVRAEEGDRE